MRTRWIYFLIAAVAVSAVIYPVAYSEVNGASLNSNPFSCTPLIPCQGPTPGFESCNTICYVTIRNSTFIPGTVNATVGSTIVWVNHDGFGHTSTALNTSAWSSPPIAAGQSWSLTIGKNYSYGEYFYHCNIHPFMIGIVNVVANST